MGSEMCIRDRDVIFLRDSLQGRDSTEGIKQFEKLIRHFELSEHRDFHKYFKNTKSNPLSSKPVTHKPKLPNVDLYLRGMSLFPQNLQDKVISYWRERQKTLRRPLLRRHWRILHLNNHGYGEQDNNKLAFANRTNNKMNLRKSNRMLSGGLLVEKLKELLKENQQLLFMVKMVKQRELLKLDQLMLGFGRKDASKYFKKINEDLETSRVLVGQVKDKVLNDEPFSEAHREDKEDNEQDCLAFFCNIVAELSEIDLKLENFESRALDSMKDKFFELKNLAGVSPQHGSSYQRRQHFRGLLYIFGLGY